MTTYDDRIYALVIQDSVEAMRQPHADLNEFFTARFKRLTGGYDNSFKIDFVSGRQAVHEIQNLSEDTHYDVIIIASNAMIRRDSAIYKCFSKNEDKLPKVVAAGKGVVIFHQGFAGEQSDVEFLSFAGAGKWVSRNTREPLTLSFNNNHPLLHYPNEIPRDHFEEDEDGTIPLHGQSADSTAGGMPACYYAVIKEDTHLSSNFRDVISYTLEGATTPSAAEAAAEKRCVLATYENRGRLIICPYPADWARDEIIFDNILHYAVFGMPSLIFLTSGSHYDVERSSYYYKMLNSRLSSGIPSGDLVLTDEEPDNRTKYLIDNANLFITDSHEALSSALHSEAIREAISKGAALACAYEGATSEVTHERIELVLGPTLTSASRKSIENLLDDDELKSWIKTALIHDIRDLILALHAFYPRDKFERFLISTSEVILHRAKTWLNNEKISVDPNTAIISAWLYKVAGGDIHNDSELSEQLVALRKLNTDPRCNDMAYALASVLTHVEAIREDRQGLHVSSSTTLGSLVRYLDSLHMCEVLGATNQMDDDARFELFSMLYAETAKWQSLLSIDEANIATIATITRGIVKFRSEQGDSARYTALAGKYIRLLLRFLASRLSNRQSFDPHDKLAPSSAPARTDIAPSADASKSVEIASSNTGEIASSLPGIIAAGALSVVERSYPLGAYEVLSTIASDSSGLSVANSMTTTRSIDAANREQELALRLSRQSRLVDLRNKEIENLKETNAEKIKQFQKDLRDRLVIAAIACWVLILALVAIDVFLFTNLIRALYGGADYLGFLGEFVSLTSITVAIVGFFLKRKMLVWAGFESEMSARSSAERT